MGMEKRMRRDEPRTRKTLRVRLGLWRSREEERFRTKPRVSVSQVLGGGCAVSQNSMVCAKQAMGGRWRAWASFLLVFPVWGRENLEVRREDPEYRREVRLGGSPLPLDHQVAIYIPDNHAKRSLVYTPTCRPPDR
ncbi:unnamed protein product [Darwinula stevensoni]|uniref:Uncharacterized protein n=1 Tax=Darwinula stevensoni TaxID=69355 RepID=A0A7R8X603_9CRUS|nr:unnamed protein product [Darwinula stevensoni]CAG0887613.1 unnamed protein product [Darwinula stevensoni]